MHMVNARSLEKPNASLSSAVDGTQIVNNGAFQKTNSFDLFAG